MKKPIILFYIFIFTSFLLSGQEKTQMQNVMDIHNKVMHKMETTVLLTNKLKSKASSSEKSKQYEEAIEDLKSANTSMIEWMKGFGNRFDADEMLKGKALTDQKRVWLNEEEAKLKALQKQINESVENAEKLIAQ